MPTTHTSTQCPSYPAVRPDPSATAITVHPSSGITTKGQGTYKLGDKVKLTGPPGSSKTFKGFTIDGNTLDCHDSFEFAATDSMVFFALAEGEYALYRSGTFTDPVWTVTDDQTGKIIKTVYSNPAIVSLDADRSFSAKLTAKSDGKTVTYKDDFVTGVQFKNNYSWTYNSKTYGAGWTGYLADYLYYKNANTDSRRHVSPAEDSKFVTYTDSSILAFRDYLEEQSAGMTKLQRANFVLRFVQKNIEYTKDASGKGMNEYWKYPYETLYDMRGDCEDSAILYASLMKSLGYEVALILYDDHMATGIGMPSGTSGTYYEKNGTCYYYCETTATGW